jgi:hypothetical protein
VTIGTDILTGLPANIPAPSSLTCAEGAGHWNRTPDLEKHFNSGIKTLAYPKAALFGFALASVA